MIHIYVHYPTTKEARRISQLILQKHLAACVNFIRQEDMYWWQGKMKQTKGIITLIATQKKYFRTIKELIKTNHSYEVPCIIEIPIGRTLRSYERWLIDETKNPRSRTR